MNGRSMPDIDKKQGIIIKGIGGFYYVKAADALIECKPRGIFRQRNITPVAGDRVILEEEHGDPYISEILPRDNVLGRPPVANVDQIFIVVSTVSPQANSLLTDKLIVIAEYYGIDVSVILTKTDLRENTAFEEIYRKAGFEVFNSSDPESLGAVREKLKGKISVFEGNTGVGKSTFINRMFPELSLETGETSKKLGRGKHTTRAVELYECEGGYIADTPGFSTIDYLNVIDTENLDRCYREFVPHLGKCYYSDCRHINESGCGVIEALERGEIGGERFANYRILLSEIDEFRKQRYK